MEQFGVQIGHGVTHQSFERDEVIDALLYEMRAQEIDRYSAPYSYSPELVVREWSDEELNPWALADFSSDELRDAALEFSGRVD